MPHVSTLSHNQIAKTVPKPSAAKQASTSGVFKRAPLVSSQGVAKQASTPVVFRKPKLASSQGVAKEASTSVIFRRAPLVSSQDVAMQAHNCGLSDLKIPGNTEFSTAHARNTASGIVKQQLANTQQQLLSSHASKAPFCAIKRPLLTTLHKHARSQASQGKLETQEALKTVQRTDRVCANRQLAQRSCVISKPNAVTSKAAKTPGQTLNSKKSTNSETVPVKSLARKTEKRTGSTKILSQAPSNVSQTMRLRPLDHGSTRIQDKSRQSTLRSVVSEDNHKSTTLSRKPPNSVVSKPASTTVPRARKAPASSNVPQTKASAAMAPADMQQKVATTAKGFSQPSPKSSKPFCRPATATPALSKTVQRLTTNTGLLMVPEHLKTPATQNRPLIARPRTELKSTLKKPTAAQEERL